jgi:hypothetical protein
MRMLLVLLFLAIVLPLAPVTTPAMGTAAAATRSTLSQYRTWMEAARLKYPYKQSVDKMYRVMMCESSGNVYALSPSGTYKGLFQYHNNTWRGSWNPYRYASVWDAKSQIYATAKAWSLGYQRWWSCYYITAGR